MKMLGNIFVCLLIASIARADVIVGDAKFIDGPPSSVMLVAPESGGLSVIINNQGEGSYEFTDGILTTYGLYAAVPALEFTSTYAASHSVLVPGTSIQAFALNETRYYAYWGAPISVSGIPEPDDKYGWVSLTHTGSELVISDSATATSGGIIVGTYTQIPEPSSVLLLTMGSGGILFYRRAKYRQTEQHISRRSFR